MAHRTSLRGTDGAGAMARFAGIEPCNRQFLHRAANRVPEINLDLIFQVAARLVFRLHAGTAMPAAEKLAEEVTEARTAARRARSTAEIEPAKIEINIRLALGMCPARRASGRLSL